MSTLALFDLDHTLLPIDSDYSWGKFLVSIGAIDKEKFDRDNERLMAQYNAGTIVVTESLPILLGQLVGHSRAKLDEWRAQYIEQIIKPAITPQALALVNHHKQRGHLCAIVTGTNSFITAPIAPLFGIEHLLGTIPTMHDNGTFTGGWTDTPTFRGGKVERVERWLAQTCLHWGAFEETWFYSDSINDVPLLEKVTHPVATNPAPSLEKIAIERGWRMIKPYGETH